MEISLLLEKYERCNNDATIAEVLAELEENLFVTFPQLLLSLLSRNIPAESIEVTKRLLLLCSDSLNPKELFLLLEQHSSPFFASVSGSNSSAMKQFVDLLLRVLVRLVSIHDRNRSQAFVKASIDLLWRRVSCLLESEDESGLALLFDITTTFCASLISDLLSHHKPTFGIERLLLKLLAVARSSQTTQPKLSSLLGMITQVGGVPMLLQESSGLLEYGSEDEDENEGEDGDGDGDGDRDETDVNDETGLLLHLGVVEYFNASLATEGFHFPMVYNASYLLTSITWPIIQVLKHRDAELGHKSVDLLRLLLRWIPNSALGYQETCARSWGVANPEDSVVALLKELIEYMVKRCDDPKRRESVFLTVFNPLLDRCESHYRVYLLEALLETPYSTATASLLYCVKEQFHRMWKERSSILCERTVRLLLRFLSLDEKTSDGVILNPLVNTLRFMLLVDKDENRSGIWSEEILAQIERQQLKLSDTLRSRIDHHTLVAKEPSLLLQQMRTIKKFTTGETMTLADCKVSNESAALNLQVIDSLVQHNLDLIEEGKKRKENGNCKLVSCATE